MAAFTGTIFHLCINHAYKLVDVTMTQPYSFLGLIFSSILGYYIFNEIPDIYTWFGALIIFIIIAIIALYFTRVNYGDYSLKKTISACTIAQKQKSKEITNKEAREICEKKIKKNK